MSSHAACPATRLSSATALGRTVACSRPRVSGRSTDWEPQWLATATRPSGITTSPSYMSNCLGIRDWRLWSTWNSQRANGKTPFLLAENPTITNPFERATKYFFPVPPTHIFHADLIKKKKRQKNITHNKSVVHEDGCVLCRGIT